MHNSEYIALAGQIGSSNKLKVVSNNAANAATPGFKADGVIFQKWMHHDIQKQESMPTDAKTFISYEQGALKQTGNKFDFAISGSGFFAVTEPNGTLKFTRNGKFTLSSDGMLLDMHGRSVIDIDGGIINIGGEYTSFDVISDGRIFVNNEEIGAIGLFNFADGEKIRKGQYGDFIIDGVADIADMSQTRILQGMTEVSNVDSMLGLLELAEVNRQIDSNNLVMNVSRDNRKSVYKIFGKSFE